MAASGPDGSTQELVAALRTADAAEWVYLWRRLQERDDAGPHLAAILRGADPRLKQRALSTLSGSRSPELTAALVEALDDERRPLRRLAVASLGNTGDPAAVAPLLGVLDSPQPPDLRGEAVRALARLGGERAAAGIAAALQDSDPGVRQAAEDALRDLRGDTPVHAGVPDLDLPGSWYSDPLLHASSQIYTFHDDGTGEVEDFNMGVTNERALFSYALRDGTLEFRFAGGEPRRTPFRVEAGTFRHPYKGALPCGVLVFAREPYFTTGPREDVPYYRLPDDE